MNRQWVTNVPYQDSRPLFLFQKRKHLVYKVTSLGRLSVYLQSTTIHGPMFISSYPTLFPTTISHLPLKI